MRHVLRSGKWSSVIALSQPVREVRLKRWNNRQIIAPEYSKNPCLLCGPLRDIRLILPPELESPSISPRIFSIFRGYYFLISWTFSKSLRTGYDRSKNIRSLRNIMASRLVTSLLASITGIWLSFHSTKAASHEGTAYCHFYLVPNHLS